MQAIVIVVEAPVTVRDVTSVGVVLVLAIPAMVMDLVPNVRVVPSG